MSQLGHHSFDQIFDNFRISGAIFLRFCVNVKTFWIISRYSYCIAGFILEKIGANNTSSPRTTPNRNLLGCRGFSSIASGFSSFISCSFVCWWKCVSSLKRMKKILRCFFFMCSCCTDDELTFWNVFWRTTTTLCLASCTVPISTDFCNCSCNTRFYYKHALLNRIAFRN